MARNALGRFYSRNLEFGIDSAVWCLMTRTMIDHEDFSVVVKHRAPPPKAWRWEIYRAGRTSPIEHSEIFFGSAAEASRAGKVALSLLLSEFQN
jgi:hypothetical protein